MVRNYWFFQSNPDRYDIDGAIDELDTIRWRVPQYTGTIRPGDRVAIWRSGSEAGVVGGGTVIEAPREMESPEEEQRFNLASEDLTTTRVPLRVRRVSFISKEKLKQNRILRDHQIVLVPMGTVFPLTEEEWSALVELAPGLQNLPDVEKPQVRSWPQPFSWEDRLKSVYPLPGGYDGYLDTLVEILNHVEELRPERESLEEWLQRTFGTSSSNSRYAIGFLERISLLIARSSGVELTPEAGYWFSSRDPGYLLALIHSRVRFMGELLALIEESQSTDELLEQANLKYGMNWRSRAQIDRRRGWLESTGAIETDDQGRWGRTEFGTALLDKIRIEPPWEKLPAEKPSSDEKRVDQVHPPMELDSDSEEALRLEHLLAATSVDTSDHTAFEKSAAEAFAFLGFQSSWLGGSGKTDVLLVADLAPDEAYRVIVDCKTTGREAVKDNQIDWVTLKDHRQLHEADYIVVMANNFAGGRVFERAADENWRTLLLDVETMGSLLRQHAQVPLDLATYRCLFTAESAETAASALAEIAEDVDRRFQLAAHACRLIAEHEGAEGGLRARDLYWLLRDYEDEIGSYTEDEIDESLSTLASPAIGALRRRDEQYLSLGSSKTAARRLRLMARLISANDSKDGSPAAGVVP